MRLIVISPSKKQDNEIPFLLNMFEQGLMTYHVRKKSFSTRELKNYLEQIPKKFHNRIVIHSHHELALRFDLKGIYLSRTHKKRKLRTWFWLKWFKLRRSKLEISTTFRSIEAVSDYSTVYDHIFLSPVFDSLSGNFQSAFSYYNLKPALKNSPYKVMARGGVAADKIQEARDLGFAGAAFYSSIWKTASPVQEFQKVKAKFVELNISME